MGLISLFESSTLFSCIKDVTKVSTTFFVVDFKWYFPTFMMFRGTRLMLIH